MLHGNPDTHVIWNGVVSRLVATHRCIAPDMPEFGASVAPPDFDVSLRGQSRFVDALFDALELPRAKLVCHDVGGTYGLALFVNETKKGSPGITDELARSAYREFHPRARRMVLRFYRWLKSAKLAGWDAKLLAATAHTPKQVLWGDRDPYMPDRTIADRFGVEAVHFEDAGHWAMIDRPDDVAAGIARLAK